MAGSTEINPRTLRATCECGSELWDIREGEWTLRTRIVRFKHGRFEAMCADCKRPVQIPFLSLVEPPAQGTRVGVRRRIVLTPGSDSA